MLRATIASTVITTLATAALGQDSFNLAGTVLTGSKTGLSYETRGCITAVSSEAVKSGLATKGQVLIALDDRSAKLTLATTQARLADLEAAVDERAFAITSAKADMSRATQDLEFADKEFKRTEVLFRRGLINDTQMETVEKRKSDATFAVDRASEALIRAEAAKARAEIARDIGILDVEARTLDLDALIVRAPFDGVLLDFEPNVGDCVQDGAQAATIYGPNDKVVETFVLVDQLANAEGGVSVGNTVNVIRTNGDTCPGTFASIGTEANLETQNVKTTIDLDSTCAPALFLNEAVEIKIQPSNG